MRAALKKKVRNAVFAASRHAYELFAHYAPPPADDGDPRLIRITHRRPNGSTYVEVVDAINGDAA